MAENEKSVAELREEAVKALLSRIARSTQNSNSDASKVRDLAQAVSFLEN